ncbi:hypothetical protein FYJ38_12690 [Clostridium sp. WB02_MRS01]|uniref:hypothetical protein n=1 Tax=Clostridium sp. WB02_MRS01 TaxID=2605777 RepID=UPI0012B2A163|nr:hypothetical protein [Clostridium sp. WB02_MRS01]MSS09496.1 hypothetical protein [Clostridium sp. WB02_MRS01]
MKEWYLTTPIPNITSGYESDSISEYAQNNFTDVLETTFSDIVILYSGDLSESSVEKCIVQGNVSNSQTKSIERAVLFPIGTSTTGNYIFYDNAYWLLIGYPGNNKSYEKVIAVLCNYRLFWQNSDGKIVSRYAWVQNASAYNNGESGNNTITLQSNQFMVYVPYDDDTLLLDNGIRMHMSRSNRKCKPYKLTRPDDIAYGYGEKGVLNLVFTQDEYNPEKDKLIELDDESSVWICNYFSPTTTPVPTPPDETANLSAVISGNTSLKIGFERTYTVTFSDADGNAVDDVEFEWNVVSDFDDKIFRFVNGKTIKLKVDDDSLIDESFLLSVTIGGNHVTKVRITLAEGF